MGKKMNSDQQEREDQLNAIVTDLTNLKAVVDELHAKFEVNRDFLLAVKDATEVSESPADSLESETADLESESGT